MGGMSRQKGKRGERMWAEFLRSHGFAARRGVQYDGGHGSPDVVCHELQHWFEVKFVEALNIHAAMAQAVGDAPTGRVPVVAHRRNRGEWLITMRAEDWINAVKAALSTTFADRGASGAAREG